MKLLVTFALFAFLALQMSYSTPAPDEKNKEIAATQVISSDAPAATVVEAKTEEVNAEATVAKVETTAPVEVKKT